VTLRGVTKVFPAAAGGNAVHALGPIDIEIKKGEFFAVVGPSGCGKSTLLELIAGLTAPTEGEIEFEGRAIRENVPDGIGVVFQEDACFPWLNVLENVEFGLRQKNVDAGENARQAAAVIDMMGLRDLRGATRRNCREACVSAFALRAPSWRSRALFSSMSPSVRWTSRRGC
jgi:NitT/TauT family transport system ATP-binding protein